MENLCSKIEESAHFIQERTDFSPEIGIILGTGLELLPMISRLIELFPMMKFLVSVSTVESHHGNLIIGELSGKRSLLCREDFTIMKDTDETGYLPGSGYESTGD